MNNREQFFVAGEDAQYAEMSRLLKANPELLEEYVKRNASKKTLEQVASVDIWYWIIFNQWAEKRSERLKKPTKVTRGKSNLSSWKVPSKTFRSKDIFSNNLDNVIILKYSSGRDKHEVLEEMTSHLGDSSTKPTDKGQVVIIEQLIIARLSFSRIKS